MCINGFCMDTISKRREWQGSSALNAQDFLSRTKPPANSRGIAWLSSGHLDQGAPFDRSLLVAGILNLTLQCTAQLDHLDGGQIRTSWELFHKVNGGLQNRLPCCESTTAFFPWMASRSLRAVDDSRVEDVSPCLLRVHHAAEDTPGSEGSVDTDLDRDVPVALHPVQSIPNETQCLGAQQKLVASVVAALSFCQVRIVRLLSTTNRYCGTLDACPRAGFAKTYIHSFPWPVGKFMWKPD